MVEAVIFDMDGVIIDSEPFHKKVNYEIYKKLGFHVSEEEYGTFIGVSNKLMWAYLKDKHSLSQQVDELVQMQRNGNMEYLLTSDEKPIAGLIPLLQSLEENGITMAVASSSPINSIELVLEKFGIKDYFKVVVSGDFVTKGKPDPEIFLHTSRLLGIHPGNCAVIEDSTHGVKAAKAAEMKCIGFQNLNSGNQDLSAADMKVDSLEELDFNVIKRLYEAG